MRLTPAAMMERIRRDYPDTFTPRKTAPPCRNCGKRAVRRVAELSAQTVDPEYERELRERDK